MAIPHGTLSGFSYHKCRCDECRAVKKAKDRAYYLANQERIKARQNAKYVPTPLILLTEEEKRSRKLTRQAEYREAHRDEIKKASLDRYYSIMTTNPEHIRKLRRDYAKTPYGRALYQSAQHNRRRETPYSQEAIDWITLIDWDTEICTYCEISPAVEVDHILPITKGGTGERDNLTPVCRSCNARKGNRYLADFLGFVEPERVSSYA